MVTEPVLAEIRDAIVREFRPERIVLFGSYAYGRPGEGSDLDLLVVMPYRGTALGKAAEIAQKVRTPFALDIIVRSREEIAQRLAWNDRFVGAILARGRVLYAADHV